MYLNLLFHRLKVHLHARHVFENLYAIEGSLELTLIHPLILKKPPKKHLEKCNRFDKKDRYSYFCDARINIPATEIDLIEKIGLLDFPVQALEPCGFLKGC